MRRWLEEGSDELAAAPYIDPDEILAGIPSYEGECIGLARKLFERFIDIAAAAKKA